MIQPIRRSRLFGWDRNPLRRRIDRLEAAMVAGLIALFAVTAPVLATLAGHSTSAALTREQHAQASWRRVSAVTERNAPRRQDLPSTANVFTPARWIAPDGQQRRGSVPVSPGTAAGARTPVWVSRSGSLTSPPLQRFQLQGWTVSARVSTVLGLAFILWLAGRVGRFQLDRRRLAYWDNSWRAVGPRWTRQRLTDPSGPARLPGPAACRATPRTRPLSPARWPRPQSHRPAP